MFLLSLEEIVLCGWQYYTGGDAEAYCVAHVPLLQVLALAFLWEWLWSVLVGTSSMGISLNEVAAILCRKLNLQPRATWSS